jgi:hypothetical protein
VIIEGPVRLYVTTWGYRTRKDGSRADMPTVDIYSLGSRYEPETMPAWLRELAEARPALVPSD